MRLAGQVVVVTGAAHGIGRALCDRFRRENPRAIVAADIAAIEPLDGIVARHCDVSVEADIARLVAETEERIGPIGLFCSNAGIARMDPDPGNAASAGDAAWAQSWAVNVMAHVYAARALVPRMQARGGGYLLNTVSAAGLLSQIGGSVYATTKHAALGFAECLAIAHRDDGIKVSVLCPQGVDTGMLRAIPPGAERIDGVVSPEAVADAVVAGLDAERFLILPHPQVLGYIRGKTQDYDRWLAGMSRLRRKLQG
jgi:NAD(P)-dependent dehydrogenase (short-subunit alcohol dehydrogenase family)